ncbi:Jacalin-related lectin 3 [Rhynchospora pubera]|uniref:Jacalin-related lectin 3 n=1 Tax=Rhynchospora pubera TaxID=906938 RepID=A0AAV8CIG1_9POAL|nr:Jacalin-related lectin 3 [Rhynchospora pubera]
MKSGYENYTIVTSRCASEGFGSGSLTSMNTRMLSFPGYMEENGSITIGTPVTYGPWGGSSGMIFDDGMYTGIRQINLTRAAGICSIKVLYDRNGQAVWGNKHGYNGTVGISDKIKFDFPTEILTHITGYFGTTMLMGPTVIKSLTFHTTKTVYGPYGEEHGTFFSSCLTEGRVVGFHGHEGWYIDGIGVHILEGKVLVQQVNGAAGQITRDNSGDSNKFALALRKGGDEVTYGVLKEPVPIGPGPWGGNGGKPWDDGVFSGIKQILIIRGKFVHSIQIEYDRGGQSVWSSRHGGNGEFSHRIKFEYPNEVLNCITGYYNTNPNDGPVALRSISLYSSRGKYGPFGEEAGTYFTSGTTEGKVVGFHGRSGLYLDAIGVHMQHWLGERRSTTKYMVSKYLF